MKNKKLIYILGGIAVLAAGVYAYLHFKKTTAAATPLAGATSGTGVHPATPPPGYSGPLGGPYTWGGTGAPPDGKYTL
jgi:hypothetical protein